ncbi:uncharacterized protein EAE97_002685 [Botrytis byssoidea]|uniref:Uncharacterized protein n=1 Tax=Botrytis byssoidea TaxID=139641 RepID=A0A9P5IXQ7_9HELO|nr:uncharacterized protein EAE97_002685 [Botrytis byssoidea]KAF7951134.1 hypothetical protein EAE97_002685 [Botrytis byssoidea]
MCWPSRTKYYREPVVREVVYAPRPVSRGHHHHHHPRRVSVTSVSSRPVSRTYVTTTASPRASRTSYSSSTYRRY